MAPVAVVNALAPWSNIPLATSCFSLWRWCAKACAFASTALFWTIGIDSCWWACLVLCCGRVARALLHLPPMTCLFRLSRSVCPPRAVRSMSHAWEIRPCGAVWAHLLLFFAWLVLCVCLCLRAAIEESSEVTHPLVYRPIFNVFEKFLKSSDLSAFELL